MANKNNEKLAGLMETLLEEAVTGLLDRLRQVDCEECGARTASASDFSNVIKFLKENGFVIDPLKGGDALDAIIKELNNTAQYPELPN